MDEIIEALRLARPHVSKRLDEKRSLALWYGIFIDDQETLDLEADLAKIDAALAKADEVLDTISDLRAGYVGD